MSTKLFIDKNFPTTGGFLNNITTDFHASTHMVNFKYKPDQANRTVNKWIKWVTRNKITDLLGAGVVTERTRVIFVNTLYFSGQWKKQFNPHYTKKAKFHVNSKVTMEIPMMHMTGVFHYVFLEDLKATAIELLYKGGRVSMVVVLPVHFNGMYYMEDRLREYGFQNIQCTRRGTVSLHLPRFTINQTINYNGHIRQLNIHDIFNDVLVSGVSAPRGQLGVTMVMQGSHTQVNERGTTSATATSAIVVKNRMMQPYITDKDKKLLVFKANHPFLFFLRDKSTGLILFVGRYLRP
uniref:(California timema) hypothetical protein n=1 Tax=Timema californicum TaxID=61474 RepID=A0A7R9JER7_TIMCA|nr:unnamed protein product [Timema californicum]